MPTREKILRSRMNGFILFIVGPMYTTVHLEVFTTSVRVVDRNNYFLPEIYGIG